MAAYALFRIGLGSVTGTTEQLQLTGDDLDQLRQQANRLYSDPEFFIGKQNAQQLIIPSNESKSNVVTTDAGNQTFSRYIEIRPLGKPKEQ